MEKDLREKLWKIAREYDTKEDTHGADFHIRRMADRLSFFRTESSLPLEIIDATEASIICHDIGLREAIKDHAIISTRILTGLIRRGDLKDLPNAGWVLYAVSKHSKGLNMSKNPSSSQICAAMLSFFDHFDGIGAIGFFRMINFNHGKTLLPKKEIAGFTRKIDECLINPEGVDINSREMIILKHSCYLGMAAFNHAACFKIIKRVEPFIAGTVTEEEYIERQKELFNITASLKKQL